MPSLQPHRRIGAEALARTDRECVPGSPLLAVGLEGNRKVLFDFPGHGSTEVKVDYLALAGLHTRIEHRVVTTSYTLSITWLVQKPIQPRVVNGVSRPVVPTEDVGDLLLIHGFRHLLPLVLLLLLLQFRVRVRAEARGRARAGSCRAAHLGL